MNTETLESEYEYNYNDDYNAERDYMADVAEAEACGGFYGGYEYYEY